MYFHETKSREARPAKAVALGLVLLGIAGTLVYLVVSSLITGGIAKMSRVDPGLITEQNDPWEFWLSEIFFVFFMTLVMLLAARIFRNASRRSRKH